MPLKWEKSRKSPYACNHFAVLRVGPNSSRRQISDTRDNSLRELQAGIKVCCACGHEVDSHQVGHATSQLLEGGTLAEELLLIHPQPPKDNRAKVQALADNLHKAATLPLPRTPISLRHPVSVFWFTPMPAEEAVALPDWADLGLVRASDAQDLDLDIVFDN